MAHAMFDVACLRATSRMRCGWADAWAMAPRPCAAVPDVYTVLCVGQRTYAVARARGEMNLRLSGLQSEIYERVDATLASKHKHEHKYFYVISSCLVCREMNVA